MLKVVYWHIDEFFSIFVAKDFSVKVMDELTLMKEQSSLLWFYSILNVLLHSKSKCNAGAILRPIR